MDADKVEVWCLLLAWDSLASDAFASPRRPKRRNRFRPPRADFSMDSSPELRDATRPPRGLLGLGLSLSPVAKREKGVEDRWRRKRRGGFEF